MDTTELTDFKKALTDNGYSENEFTLHFQDLTDWKPNQILSLKREVTIKRLPKNIVRVYQAGNGTPYWVTEFESELKRGVFNS